MIYNILCQLKDIQGIWADVYQKVFLGHPFLDLVTDSKEEAELENSIAL